MKLSTMVPTANHHGEGPLWNERDGKLWWTDIDGRSLCRYSLESGAIERSETPQRLCSFAFLPDRSSRILAAFDTGLAYFDIESKTVEWISQIEESGNGRRLNDGRTDLQGRFWIGSMVENKEKAGADSAALFCLDGKGQLVRHAGGVAISNSLCTSPDGRTLYFADSPKKAIHAYDLDPETGAIANKRLFAEVPDGEPDGSVTDEEGCLWSARWGTGEVVRHAPDGKVLQRVSVPAKQVSCPAFGGPDRKTLFVTSSRQGFDATALAQDPNAGNLFIFRADVAGVPNTCFGG